MGTYGFSAEFLERHRRRVRLVLPLMLAIVLMGSVAFRRDYSGDLFAIVPIVGIAMAFAMWRAFRRQTVVGRSFRIDVQPDRIVRSLEGFPTVTLLREEVVRLEQHPAGEITVHARDPKQSLRITAGIERRDELLRELESWGPVERGASLRSPGWGPALAVLIVVAFAVTVNATNPVLVAIVGGLLFLTLVTCSVLLIRTGQPNLRRLGLIAFVPAIAVLVRVISVL